MFRNGGGEQHGDSESWTGGARYDNRKENLLGTRTHGGGTMR